MELRTGGSPVRVMWVRLFKFPFASQLSGYVFYWKRTPIFLDVKGPQGNLCQSIRDCQDNMSIRGPNNM